MGKAFAKALVVMLFLGVMINGCSTIIPVSVETSKEDFVKLQKHEPIQKTTIGHYEIWLYNRAKVFFKEGKYLTHSEIGGLNGYSPTEDAIAILKSGRIREEYVEYIAQRRMVRGMNKDELLLSWGDPKQINETVGSWGKHEQWVYGDISYSAHLIYFENGVLTSWQNIGK